MSKLTETIYLQPHTDTLPSPSAKASDIQILLNYKVIFI